MANFRKRERGVALVMALAVVALLTITVTEFFFSAEIDARMARNSVHSLQAALLARSGITLGEALLVQDQDPLTDSFLEEWCPLQAREGKACQIDDGGGLIALPPNSRLRVEIWDESGKVNINLTRPQTQAEWRAGRLNPNPEQAPQRYQAWLFTLGRLMNSRPEAITALDDYWNQLFELYFGPIGSPNMPGTTPTPGAPAGLTPGAAATPPPLTTLYFGSLDEVTAVPGFVTQEELRRLRPYVTAYGWPFPSQVNANTAPREVLNAIIGDAQVVDEIIQQRQSQVLQASSVLTLVNSASTNQDPIYRNARTMLGARSNVYSIRATAIVNLNPMTGMGGISRSAVMLVRRDPKQVQPGATGGTVTRWKLTRLYWQKEGGAVLFRPEAENADFVEF
ncbi:MAG: type II secretion system protein GspK [Candidatus Binatia bacterium]|nr:type II secretion system protein GspK [Candidatus Binatia bacterium]